jgi:hypothetical protein
MNARQEQTTMRIVLILILTIAGAARAAVSIGPAFWDSYEPYRQYSARTLRNLATLRESDLLETARDIDGLELRVVGREGPASALISARVVIDSVVRERLQIKIVPFELSSGNTSEPTTRRHQLSPDETEALVDLLERTRFWEAPYRYENPGSGQCSSNDGHWVVEAYRPGSYQIVARSTCPQLDSVVAAVRDFLLGIAGITKTGGIQP